MCYSASASKLETEQAPERENAIPGHERCMVVVMVAPDRLTQIFNGQNGKEITVFPLRSRHKPHESQEFQRGSTEVADLQDASQQFADAFPPPKT